MKISFVLIVKNESSCLDRCLESIKKADEIIVVDTGSTDNTIEIAKKYTDKVFDDYKWQDSFADARNHALSKATGDWIFSIDADQELLNTIDEVRNVAEEADKKGFKAVNVRLISGNNSHIFPLLFKRLPEVFWCGSAHNYLSVRGEIDSDLKIGYSYSKAHSLDPDRTLRILLKEIKKDESPRNMYYLAREYWYRKDYITAIYWWEKYVAHSSFLSEQADAYLMLARCYWALRQGEKARQNCIKALNINANFKEAILFMASISWEHNAKQWRKMAETATNERVLFIRN